MRRDRPAHGRDLLQGGTRMFHTPIERSRHPDHRHLYRNLVGANGPVNNSFMLTPGCTQLMEGGVPGRHAGRSWPPNKNSLICRLLHRVMRKMPWSAWL